MGQPSQPQQQTIIQHQGPPAPPETHWYDFGWEWLGLIIPAIIIFYFKERISLFFKKKHARWQKSFDNGEDV